MTVETDENVVQQESAKTAPERLLETPATAADLAAVWVEPDLDFIRSLRKQGGEDFKKCIQCGTCSGTCTISPDSQSFPCKEMAWAAWGMKDQLLKDLDVWLCYQCNDCSARCPRGARPGYVLGAVRQECIKHYAVPGFLGRWASQPQGIPLLLGIPAALLTLALFLKEPLEKALGITREAGDQIIYAYSNVFPHWLLNSFFFFFSILTLIAAFLGARRFWRALQSATVGAAPRRPVKELFPSIVAALKSVITHDKFASCEKARPRHWSHLCVFFGFVGLMLVTIWVITAEINPLIRGSFIYPFGFWNPWKLLANVGGAAVLVGCLLMIKDRAINSEEDGAGSYFDWFLIATLLFVVLSGFFTEVLHYVRLEPHRHIAYFAHLVFVFTLLMYLPYSKFAHVIYRTVALVYAERIGRNSVTASVPAGRQKVNA